jgi:carbamate kinase
MEGKRIVVALGGNALGNTPQEQIEAVQNAAKIIVKLIKAGNKLVIGHGNGPQIGMINLAMDYAERSELNIPHLSFDECGAMSQGYIGYHLQQAIQQTLKEENIDKSVLSIVTEVEVNKDDQAFLNPTKPIGRFYDEKTAKELADKLGFKFKYFENQGYRRVVPSPHPKKIVEINSVKLILEDDIIAITVGGGGIPVVFEEGKLKGVEAVIDKDRSCAKLANDLDADVLLILTAVDYVYKNFGRKDQETIKELSVSDAKKYIDNGFFGVGSMLPKVEACVDFVKNHSNRVSIITSLEKAADALQGNCGTRIIMGLE